MGQCSQMLVYAQTPCAAVRRQYPAGEPRLQQREFAPVTIRFVGWSAGEDGPEAFLGERERALVVGADGLVEQAAAARAHLGAAVPEQRHQRLEANAGIDERGRICVPKLVGHYRTQAGFGGGALELASERVVGESLAVVGEQELDPPTVPGMEKRLAG